VTAATAKARQASHKPRGAVLRPGSLSDSGKARRGAHKPAQAARQLPDKAINAPWTSVYGLSVALGIAPPPQLAELAEPQREVLDHRIDSTS
jgi:hypothetical protein